MVGGPQDYTVISWDWGYLSIPIPLPIPNPIPSPIPSPSRLTIILALALTRGFFPSRHNDSEEVAFKHLYFRTAIKLHIFHQMPPACSHGAGLNNVSQCKHFCRFKAEIETIFLE